MHHEIGHNDQWFRVEAANDGKKHFQSILSIVWVRVVSYLNFVDAKSDHGIGGYFDGNEGNAIGEVFGQE